LVLRILSFEDVDLTTECTEETQRAQRKRENEFKKCGQDVVVSLSNHDMQAKALPRVVVRQAQDGHTGVNK